MPISRYAKDSIILKGTTMSTATAFRKIKKAVASNSLSTSTITTQGLGRLDELAGNLYGDSRYWWILAAASDIGWGLQIPGGTMITVPDLSQVVSLLT